MEEELNRIHVLPVLKLKFKGYTGETHSISIPGAEINTPEVIRESMQKIIDANAFTYNFRPKFVAIVGASYYSSKTKKIFDLEKQIEDED